MTETPPAAPGDEARAPNPALPPSMGAMAGIDVTDGALLRQLIDQAPDLIFVKDMESRFVLANTAVLALIGHSEQGTLMGQTDFDLHPREQAESYQVVEQFVMASGESVLNRVEPIVDALGRSKILSTSRAPLRNEEGAVVGVIGVARDVTEEKAAEDQARHVAQYDRLTGLPNRDLLKDRLSQSLVQAALFKSKLIVVVLDIDHFKRFNDRLGHDGADDLLVMIADRLGKVVEPSDTVARIGGDEFVLLLADHPNREMQVLGALARLRSRIAEPFSCRGQSLTVTCSLGIASYPADGTDIETLLRNADAAMYRAKHSGRDTFQFYAAEMNSKVQDNLTLQEEMRAGMARGDFRLVYQPQVDLRSGRIFGVEALLRWHHPQRGIIAPNTFIPIAEDSGLIVGLGDWVLRTACLQNRVWQHAGLPKVSVAVNVSPRQFREKDWLAKVGRALDSSGLDSRWLELEITENVIIQDIERVIATMTSIKAMGVQLSIDDFGTGYSSLSALKRLPVSRLKIDRSFVSNIEHEESDRAIATAIISLGLELQLKVIAEGVETEEQMRILRAHRCDEMQGYYFSRPVDAAAITALLRAQANAA